MFFSNIGRNINEKANTKSTIVNIAGTMMFKKNLFLMGNLI